MNRLVDTEGETNWESSPETYTLPNVTQIAGGSLLCDAGTQTRCSVMT